MSVIKNKRSVSKHEFAHQFGKLYDFATLEISKMPKRRREYISAKIMEPLNEAIDYIGWLNDPFWLRKINAEPQELVKKIRDEFLKLNKALLVACNAKAFPAKRLLCWQTN